MAQRDRQRRSEGAKRAEAREARRQRHQTRKRRRRILFAIAAGFFALAIIASFAISGMPFLQPGQSGAQPSGRPGLSMPIQGNQHIQPGESHPPYNSLPPTSGWHYGTSEQWGISPTQIPDEIQVHNLEHGGVLIQYDTEDKDLIGKLEAVAKQQPTYPCYLLVAPYKGLTERNAPIALTAWGVLMYLDKYDEAGIQAFISAYRDRGPEKVPCTP